MNFVVFSIIPASGVVYWNVLQALYFMLMGGISTMKELPDHSLRTKIIKAVLAGMMVFSVPGTSVLAEETAASTADAAATAAAESTATAEATATATAEASEAAETAETTAASESTAAAEASPAASASAEAAASAETEASASAESSATAESTADASASTAAETAASELPAVVLEDTENTDVVTVQLIWDDAENGARLRADSVTIALTSNGEPYPDSTDQLTAAATADNDWTVTFSDLPAGNEYDFTFSDVMRLHPEDIVSYETSSTKSKQILDTGGTETDYRLKCHLDTKPAELVISWQDLSDQFGRRPETVYVYSDQAATTIPMTSDNADSSDADVWRLPIAIGVDEWGRASYAHYFIYSSDNPLFSDSDPDVEDFYDYYEYSDSGSMVRRYASAYGMNDSGDYVLDMVLKNCSVDVLTTWLKADGSAYYGYTLPQGYTVTLSNTDGSEPTILYRGTENQVFQNKTSNQFYLLAVDADGNAVSLDSLQAEQSSYPGYTCTGESASGSGYNRTFTFQNTQNTPSHTAEIVWDTGSLHYTLIPSEVTLTLMAEYADGTQKTAPVDDASVTLPRETTTWTWSDLPLVDSDGNAISGYTGVQNNWPSLVTTSDDRRDDTTVITNTAGEHTYTVSLNWRYTVNESDRHNENLPTVTGDQKYHLKDVTLGTDKRLISYEIHVSSSSVTYAPGEMEIRVPYCLWQNDDGTWVVPDTIGLPEAPNYSTDFALNYYIDDHDTADDLSDDEIVFTNWTDYTAAKNTIIPVSYVVSPANTTDFSQTAITASCSAGGIAETSNTITYQMDTGVQVNEAGKRGTLLRSPGTLSGYTLLDSSYTVDTDNYHYVVWEVQGNGYCNADATVYYTDTLADGDNGTIVGWQVVNGNYHPFGRSNSTDLFSVLDSVTAEDGRVTSLTIGAEDTDKMRMDTRYGVPIDRIFNPDYADSRVQFVVAYPYDSTTLNATYTNTVTLSADVSDHGDAAEEEDDLNDHSSRSATATVEWSDYVYDPDYIYAFEKSFNDASTEILTYLSNSVDATIGGELRMVVNGAAMTDDETRRAYQIYLEDRDLYWNTSGADSYTDYVRMTSEDFYYSSLTITLELYDLDKTTGERITPAVDGDMDVTVELLSDVSGTEEVVSTSTFTLPQPTDATYYRQSIHLATEIPSWASEGEYTQMPDNITGYRIIGPDNLVGNSRTYVSFGLTVRHDSPQYQEWLSEAGSAGEDLENVWFLNIGGNRLYEKYTNSDSFWWVNPDPDCSSPDALGKDHPQTICPPSDVDSEGNTVAARDILEYTQPIERDYDTLKAIGQPYRDFIMKRAVSYQDNLQGDDPESSYTVTFQIDASELLDGHSDDLDVLPAQLFENMAFDEGWFYDLLPMGYVYDEDSAQAWALCRTKDTATSKYQQDATVEVAQIINNYKNTGRQLVVFHTSCPAGTNYYTTHLSYDYGQGSYPNAWQFYGVRTEYLIQYTATAAYSDLIYYPSGYNEVMFYPGGTDSDGSAKALRSTSLRTDFQTQTVLTSEDASTYYDMNGNDTADRVLSARAAVAVNGLPAEDGLTKAVRGDGTAFTNEDLTHPNGYYLYRLGYITTGVRTKNLVLYDILENGQVYDKATDSLTFAEDGSQWQGVLQSIDLSIDEDIQVTPVIWYCTTSDLSYELIKQNYDKTDTSQRYDIANTDLWTTEEPADHSQIKAVAIDLRYYQNGSTTEETIIPINSPISVILKMQAPDYQGTRSLQTINLPAYSSEFVPIGETESTGTAFNIGESTLLRLYSISFAPEASKVLQSSDGSITYPIEEDQFSFQLLDEDGSVVTTGTSQADGSVYFEPYTYTALDLGTHTYTMVENAGSDSAIQYDSTEHTVTVTVYESGDTDYPLAVDVVYDGDAANDPPVFTNVLDDLGQVEVTPEAAKQLTGRTLSANAFRFEIRDEEGTQVSSGTNSADGQIQFETLRYDSSQLGTHTYTVQEVQGTQESIAYDSAVYTLQVTVSLTESDGTSTLTTEMTWSDADGNPLTMPVFQNIYNPPAIPSTTPEPPPGPPGSRPPVPDTRDKY